MAKSDRPRPRRTREHVIAAQGVNFVEKFFIDRGHVVSRPAEDYGVDLLVNTFDEGGYAENGEILVQLKASDRPAYSADGRFVSIKVDARHLELWSGELMPVFLVLYDATAGKAFWIDLHEYLRSDPARRPKPGSATVTLRVPVANEFTEATVDLARGRKASILARIEGMLDERG